MRWGERSTLVVAWALAAGLLSPVAYAAYDGPPGPYHDWFVTQRQEQNPDCRGCGVAPCCGDEEHYGGDGRFVDVRPSAGGRYEVFVREAAQWMVYPLAVNPDYPNPTGQNIAWYIAYKIGDHWDVNWFCLRLASGT